MFSTYIENILTVASAASLWHEQKMTYCKSYNIYRYIQIEHQFLKLVKFQQFSAISNLRFKVADLYGFFKILIIYFMQASNHLIAYFFAEISTYSLLNCFRKINSIMDVWQGPKGSLIYCVCKIFRKTNISYPLTRTRTCAYQVVKNVSFSENFVNIIN